MNGTSTYSGTQFTAGIQLTQETYSLALVFKPKYSLKRAWKNTITVLDTLGNTTQTDMTGTEEIQFPADLSLGIAITPTKAWTIALDYDIRSFDKVVVTNNNVASSPWLSGHVLKLGTEWQASSWLAFRGGYREESELFENAGAAILNVPITSTAYTAGLGISWKKIQLNIAYDYAMLDYEDMWQSNTNYNKKTTHTISAEIGYQF